MLNKKFLTLSRQQQHSLAGKQVHKLYAEMCTALNLPAVEMTPEALANRYHLHRQYGSQQLREDRLLPPIHSGDRATTAPFLPITIYLDHLRSAHNVGSILRTIEALRLGTVAFSPQTPTTHHPQVVRTAMGTTDLIPSISVDDPATLPRPIIALETAPQSTAIARFSFPSIFTLVVGNEEYGCSQRALEQADAIVHIPLFGAKNSLNVANAFAIAAAWIRQGVA